MVLDPAVTAPVGLSGEAVDEEGRTSRGTVYEMVPKGEAITLPLQVVDDSE